jgi:hypothetical protein
MAGGDQALIAGAWLLVVALFIIGSMGGGPRGPRVA